MQEGDVLLGDGDVAGRELVVIGVTGGEGWGGGLALLKGVLGEGERVDGVACDGVGSGDGEASVNWVSFVGEDGKGAGGLDIL